MGPPPFSGSKHSKLALNEHSESGHQKNAQKLVAPYIGCGNGAPNDKFFYVKSSSSMLIKGFMANMCLNKV